MKQKLVWWKAGLVIGGAIIGGVTLFSSGIHLSSKIGRRHAESMENGLKKSYAHLKPSKTIELGDGVKLELILIRPGSFVMGSAENVGEEDEMPPHQVTISEPFYLGKYEVTQAQWEKMIDRNPSKFKGSQNPVDSVSWNDCQQFLTQLSTRTGRKFALPTEAQWEYACRAGSKNRWFFGEDPTQAKQYAWIDETAQGKTHPVGEKQPNPWGLYDMYGNLQEWCNDRYQNPYPTGKVTDPQGAATGESRLLRGGAWGDAAGSTRSAYRNCMGSTIANDGVGLRCVLLIN